MYIPYPTRQYTKSIIKLRRSGRFPETDVNNVINTIARGERLEIRHADHQLSGDMSDFRECHIKPDLLLIYKIEKNALILILANIGSHSELF